MPNTWIYMPMGAHKYPSFPKSAQKHFRPNTHSTIYTTAEIMTPNFDLNFNIQDYAFMSFMILEDFRLMFEDIMAEVYKEEEDGNTF